MSATYCRDKRPRPIGIEEYGIHRRARHMVSETQRWSQASFQKFNVSTASTTLKASESEEANSASQKRARGPRQWGSTSTLTWPRVSSTNRLPTKVAAIRQYGVQSVRQMVLWPR